MKKSFSKKMLAMCVATLFVAPNAWAVDVVCEETNGCTFYTAAASKSPDYWIKNGNKISEDKELNLSLKAQNYINTPATETGIEESINPDGSKSYSFHPDRLIGISSYYDGMKGNLTVPTGTHLTLSQARDNSYIISLDNSNATIAEGVHLTVNAGYGETNGLTHPNKKDFWEAGDAINASGGHHHSQINTSANITLNGIGAGGIVAEHNTTVNASNHNIALNGEWTFALTTHGGAQIQTNQVHITGNAPKTAGLLLNDYEQNKSTIKFNNSSIKLTGEESVGSFLGGGNVIMENSNVQADYGLAAFPEEGVISSSVQLNNSNISGSQALLVVSPSHLRALWEDDELVANQADININASNNSQLTGGIILDKDLRQAGEPYGKININLSNNSTWTIQNSSEIDNLKLDNATVKIGKTNGFNELKINGDLSGNGAFHMNSDIAGNQADLLNVTGAVSGSHTLHIANTATEPQSTDGKLTVVKTGSSGADAFKLGNAKGVVEAGKYLYALKQNGNNWQLVYDNTQKQPENTTQPAAQPNTTAPAQNASPVAQPNTTTPAQNTTTTVQANTTTPSTPSTPTTPSVNKNFRYDLAGSLAHAQTAVLSTQAQNQALNEKQLALHQNQRLHGLWLQGETSHTKRKNSQVNGGNLSGFKDKTNTWQIGYDKEMGNGYAGVLAGQIRHNVDYHIDLYDDSKIRGNTFAVYGGLHGTSGWFMDGTLRHTRYSADNPQFERDRFRINSLNVQGGKNIALNETWTMIPNAAVTIGRLSGSQFMQDGNLLQTQAGFDLQGKFALQHGVSFQPKVGAYYVGDHRGMDVAFNGENFRADDSGSRFAAKLGADVVFNKNNVLSANFRTEHGSKIKRPYQVDVGFRRSW